MSQRVFRFLVILVFRFLVILGIVYASIFGGEVEHLPVMRITHHIGITVLLGGWLLNLWRTRRPFPQTPLDWPLLGLGIAWTVSAAFARHPRISLEYAWLIWVEILLFYMLVDLIRRGSRWRQWIVEGLLFAGVFIILFAVAEVVYRVGREGQQPHGCL